MWASLCLWLRCLLLQGQAQRKWILPSEACSNLDEETIFRLAMSLCVVANTIIESCHCFWNIWCNIIYSACWHSVALEYFILIYTHDLDPMKSVDSHGSLSMLFAIKWWSDTLWATLIRLWLHSLSCYFQIVIGEISLQFLDGPYCIPFHAPRMWWLSFCAGCCITRKIEVSGEKSGYTQYKSKLIRRPGSNFRSCQNWCKHWNPWISSLFYYRRSERPWNC